MPVPKWRAQDSRARMLFIGQSTLFLLVSLVAIDLASNLDFTDSRKPLDLRPSALWGQVTAVVQAWMHPLADSVRVEAQRERLKTALSKIDTTGTGFARLDGRIESDPEEIEACVQWAIIALLNAAAAIAFYVFCVISIASAAGRRVPPVFATLGVVILPLLVVVGWTVLRDRPISSTSMLALIVALLVEHRSFVNHFIGFMDGAGVACAVVAVLACAAQTIPPASGRWTPRVLAARLARLRVLLLFGAALLSVGVCEVWALYHWAILPLTVKDHNILEPALRAARLGIGGLSSLALLIAYVPPAFYLQSVARSFAISQTDNSVKATEWLKANGLDGSTWEPLLRLTTAFSPAIVSGPVAALIQGIRPGG